MSKVLSVNISKTKGERKKPIEQATLKPDHGLVGDAHAGAPTKQVSLLDQSDIKPLQRQLEENLSPGAFAENLTTTGVCFDRYASLGTTVRVGTEVILEVSQIGKKCHEDCLIKQKTGKCVMPSRGIFFRVLQGGSIEPGDPLSLVT